jgi:2-keto-4-pentenoate hydratase/2-oxohepta-3-ene-1,7-dioic acid hydratase in catechol pathway
MRLVCFDDFRPGVIARDETVVDLSDLVDPVPVWAAVLRVNEMIARFDELRAEVERRHETGSGRPIGDVALRAPTPRPRNFLAAPVNFVEHGAEMQGPMATNAGTARDLGFFVKAGGSVSGAADGVELPPIHGRRFDHEAEVGVVIGQAARGVTSEEALDHVFGYTLVLDGTMRMTATAREERTLRKSFATFGACGPAIVTADEVPNPQTLRVRLAVNGVERQNGKLRDLIVDVPGLVSWASSVVALEPGDLIATGSPPGVGPMEDGDELMMTCEPIGTLMLRVRRRAW